MTELDKDILQEFLKNEFPGAKIELAGEGTNSVAFIVADRIVRFAKTDFDWYRKETAITNFIRDKVKVQVPNITIVENAKCSYAIHKMLVGNNWDVKTVNKLSSQSRKQFIKNYVNFLYILHNIDIEQAKTAAPGLRAIEFKKLERDKFKLCLKDYFSESEINILYHKYEEFFDYSPNKTALLHGDFTGSNSLVDDKFRITGVFDWIDAGLGDVIYDFYKLTSPSYIAILDDVLQEYKNQSGIDVDIEMVKRFALVDIIRKIHKSVIAEAKKDKIMPNIEKLKAWL